MSTTTVLASSPTTTVSAVPSSTSTTVSPGPLELFAELIGDAGFSVEAVYSATNATDSSISFPTRGTASFGPGGASQAQVTDFSGIGIDAIDGQRGRVLGANGRRVLVQASVQVDGVMYTQEDGGRWRTVGMVDEHTGVLFAHIIGVLRDVEGFEVVGVETFRGNEVSVLEAVEGVTYDPAFFDFDPGTVEAFDSDTEILVDPHGSPVALRIEGVTAFTGGYATAFDYVYELSSVGSASPVVKPAEVWIAVSDHGFTTFNAAGDAAYVDVLVPDDWELGEAGSGSAYFETPGGAAVMFLAMTDSEPFGPQEVLDAAFAGAGIPVGDVDDDSDFGTFPSLFTEDLGDEYLLAYSEVRLNHVGFMAAWIGPPVSTELQYYEFSRVLDTIKWRIPGNGVLPGSSIADAELQTDAVELVLQPVAANLDPNCEREPSVLFTEVTDGFPDGWFEDWFVDICSEMYVITLGFFSSPGGGTDIATIDDPLPFRDSHRASLPMPSDPAEIAQRLKIVPWLIDPESAVDASTAALAIAEQRTRGANLYLIVTATEPNGDALDLADAILRETRGGTVLVIAPGTVGYSTEHDIYPIDELDAALDAALTGNDDHDVLERFINRLQAGA